MNAVIVWTASNGSPVRLGWPPAAISTIMVSPIAREIASTNDAMIPETAAGTTMRVDDLHAARPEGVRAVAEVAGHCGHGVLRDRRDGRDQHDADHEAAAERAEGAVRRPRSCSSGAMTVSAK